MQYFHYNEAEKPKCDRPPSFPPCVRFVKCFRSALEERINHKSGHADVSGGWGFAVGWRESQAHSAIFHSQSAAV